MLRSSARRSGGRRIAAFVASLAVVALLALAAHSHEVQPDSTPCAICAVAHPSAGPIPTQPIVSTPSSYVPLVEPAATVLAAQFEGALPIARAPPLQTPNA